MAPYLKHTFTAVTVCFALPIQSHAVTALNPWKEMVTNGVRANAAKQANTNEKNVLASKERLLLATFSELEQFLTHKSVGVPVSLPLPNGKVATYAFTYDPVMAPSLAAKYPNIRTYTAVDVTNSKNTGRFSITPHGFYGLFEHDGERIMIDPKLRKNKEKYSVYFEKDALPLSELKGDSVRHPTTQTATERFAKTLFVPAKRTVVAGNELITYRLAVSAAGEYTQFHGGTKAGALAAITTTINRVNQVYARDLSIKFELVSNNDKVIFTDPRTDPFINDTNTDIKSNRNAVNNNIGLNKVDIAHVFNTGGGGLATLGGLCSEYKTEGITGNPSPTGDTFDYSFVAHELGHQLGANHTFNGLLGNCDNKNRNATTSWEPGSGSTIMSYAGICSSDNLQAEGDALFHIGSIQEIRNTVNNRSCGTKTTLTNATPVANAGPNYTIPANTPFKLTGTATDTDENDTLSYIWEQYDTGSASNLNPSGSSQDVGSGALFRSYTTTSTPVRYFPKLTSVLNGFPSRGEGYPATDRTLTMSFTVRDNKGGVATDSTIITVKNTGRAFSIIQPTANTRWPEGGQGRVVWDRAGTTEATINCQKVDILYDRGNGTFTETLAKNSANDGEEIITVPPFKTNNARVMIRCSNNVFYAVNPSRFSVVDASNATALDATAIPESSGGGSIPPIMVLLLLSAALISTGCKTLSQNTNEHIPPEFADTNNHGTIDLTITPEEAFKRAIAHDDFKLYVTGGRLPIPPGIPLEKREHAKRLCGTRLLSGTGDVLRQDSDLTERKKRTEYAARYNTAMYEHCKAAIPKD